LPRKHPVLRNILDKRMIELQLLMLGIPRNEINSLSEEEINRDLILIKYLLEKSKGDNYA